MSMLNVAINSAELVVAIDGSKFKAVNNRDNDGA